MKITPGKLAVGFLLLAFVLVFAVARQSEMFGKIGTLSFAASLICAIWAVISKTSRVAGAIVLIIDAVIVGYFILIFKYWHLP